MPTNTEIINDTYDSVLSAFRTTQTSSTVTTSSFSTGQNSDVDTAAEQITTTSVAATKGVIVKAHKDNTGIVYVGASTVTAGTVDATDGFPLEAGESIMIEASNANLVYVIASVVNQKVHWLAV